VARNLGTLTVDLVLKLGGFEQGANRAARQLSAFERDVRATAARIQTGFARFSAALGAIGVGVSLGAVISELKEAAKEAIDFGDAIEKAMAATGVGAEALQELAFAAKQTDVDFQTLTTSLFRMQKAISEAASGNNKALIQTFNELGLSIKELQQLDAADQFEAIAGALAQFKDEGDRAALGADIFGKGVQTLLPLLAQGADGVREFREQAHELGVVLTEEQVKALAETDQAIKQLSAAYDGLTRASTAAIAPKLTDFFRGLTGVITDQADEVLTLSDRFKILFEVLKAGPIVGAFTFFRETGEQMEEAAKETENFADGLSELAITASRLRVPRLTVGGGGSNELKSAKAAVDNFIESLERQQATLGATAAEAQRYAVLHGEIAEALKKLGPAADGLRTKLLNLIDVGEQQAATKAIEDQIKALRDEAAQVGLTEEQLFEYQLRQAAIEGQLGKTADEQARLTAELRQAWQDMRAAVDQAAIVEAVGELDRELLELMGDTTAAAVAEITERFKKIREAAEAEIARGGPRAAQAQEVLVKIKARIDLEEFRAKAEQFRKEVEEIREEFGRREQTIQLRIETGVISDTGGRREIIKTHQEEAKALEAVIAKYPEMREEIEKVIPVIEDLKTTTNEFVKIAADAFETEFADAIADAALGMKSLEDAFRDMLSNMAESIARWASEQIASMLRDKLLEILTGVGDGMEGGILGALGGAFGGGDGLEEIAVTAQRIPTAAAETTAATAAATAMSTAITTAGATAATAITTAGTATATAIGAGGTTAATAIGTASAAMATAITTAGTAAAAAIRAASATSGLPIPGLAEGGLIVGPGTATSDSIPAWLSAGEFVVKAQAVQRPGVQQLLERINDGGGMFRGFAEGGAVERPVFIAPKYADGGLVKAMPAAGHMALVPSCEAAERPEVNIRNINAFDTSVIRDYLLSASGEEVLLNFVQRNGTRVRAATVGG
jgi:hypothetical protein